MDRNGDLQQNASGVKGRQGFAPTPPPKNQAPDSPHAHGRMSTRQQVAPLRLSAVQDTISTVLTQLDSRRAVEDHAKHAYKTSTLRSPGLAANSGTNNKQPIIRSSSPASHGAPENEALSPIPELSDMAAYQVTDIKDLSNHSALNQSGTSARSMSKLNLHGARLEDEYAGEARDIPERKRPISGSGARIFMYQRAAEAGA